MFGSARFDEHQRGGGDLGTELVQDNERTFLSCDPGLSQQYLVSVHRPNDGPVVINKLSHQQPAGSAERFSDPDN
jgi:hypothetical protein